ncbi:uncharacterized protein LOC116766237 isoform X2 [Danaus plexippus]|uniref:uncharacterized protein LOC116766237 isoform X2 n=1 Tax=Danaus plexippus TaxID=13037 RepID=UPI000239D669|nr:uncharacterized protein LOC116766237 isoform X2 [Danaus plexippus]
MRNVEPVLEDKMDEAVTHYINSHQPPESVHIDANSMALNVHDDSTGRVVTVMHPHNFTTQMCRQVSVGDQVGEGPWVEEFLDPEGRLAAIVAHLAQHSRTQHHLHKVPVRSDLDSSVILDAPMRLFNGQTLEPHSEPIVVQVPPLPPLPPLQEMKRCPEADWFNKDKNELKEQQLLSQDTVLESSGSPAHKQSKKSLPHKKRISRKLKRTTNSTPQQDIVVINCGSEVPQEEILPDSFSHAHESHDTNNGHDAHGAHDAHDPHNPHNTHNLHNPHHPHNPHNPHNAHNPHDPHDPHDTVLPETHHIGQEIRSPLICQLCGEYYGHEQLKFYHHLKQHYEPQLVLDTPDLPIDKMTNTCIDNVATLPDSIVELSLENTVPRIIYPPQDKTFCSYKIPFTSTNMEKEQEQGRVDLFDSLDKLEMYFCTKCNKSFRKQKQCEIHIKEAHLNQKMDDISEFSDPEDLMEGIHVAVEEGGGEGEGGGDCSSEQYDQALLPHLTVENGHVHQEHVRHWYMRNGSNSSVPLCTCGGAGYCAMCTHAHTPTIQPTQTIHTQTIHTQSSDMPLPSVTSVSHVTTSHVTNVNHVTSVTHTSNVNVSQNVAVSQRTEKDESLQRMFETENHSQENFTENILEQQELNIKVEQPVEVKQEKKKPTKTFECSHCDRVFHHRNSLFYHTLMHSEKQQVCRECGKEFYTVNALKIHKRVHSDYRPCKCDECGRDFRQWSDLKYHKASIHSDKKNFKCEFCGKEFARRYSLNVHRRIHTGERNYKCEYCNKSFRASSYRLIHMRTHTGTKPYKCTQCEKCFRVAYDLRRHMLIHDKVRVRGEEQKNKTKEKKQNDTKEETKETKAAKADEKKETKLPILKSLLDKKQTKPPKKSPKKAPNVTVQSRSNEQFKMDPDYNNEVFDTRQEQYKFKVYSNEFKQKDYIEEVRLEGRSEDRELATLRTLKNQECENIETNKLPYRENTDGKMQVYTQIEKTKEYSGPIVTNAVSLSDMRSLDRESRDMRNEVHGETIDSALLERLSAYYNNNIPAV